MLKFSFSFIFLSMTILGHAQLCNVDKGFQTMYWYKNVDNFGNPAEADDWNIKNLFEDTNGNIITWSTILFLDSNGMYRKCKLLSKKTPNGSPLWAKKFVDGEAIGKISLTKDNGFILALGPAGESTLVKLTSDGNVQWTSHFKNQDINKAGFGGAQVIELKNGNFIRVGTVNSKPLYGINGLISCQDKDGNLLWHKYYDDITFFNTKYVGGNGDITNVIELLDGNILVSGFHKYTRLNPDNTPNGIANNTRLYLQKINATTGSVIWSSFFNPKDSIGWLEVFFDIHERSDKSIHVHFNHSNNISNTTVPTINTYYHFDADGNFLDGKKIQLSSLGNSLESYYASTDAQDNDIFYGEITGNTTSHILFKESKDIVIWAKSYHSSLSIGSLNKITSAIIGSNSFILGGKIITHNFSGNTGKDEYQNYIIKTDAFGNTNCSDTFSIPFNIVKADTIFQYPAAWSAEKGMITSPVPINIQNLLPYELKDCLLTNSCCTTPLHYVDTVLCNKVAYILPDNTSVTLPGIYSNYFQTAKGCDSVIFTTLTQAGIPSIKLGADTCIVGSSNFTLIPQTYNSAFSSYTWQDGSRDSSYKVNMPGLYWVKASSTCGTVSDSMMIYNNCNLPVYIPSAFTPNGDGLNDVFRIIDMGHQELLDFSIFNRFGQQIFKTNNPKQGWDGKINAMDQPASVFVYYIKYKDLLGRQQSINGTVTLIR